MAAKGLTQEDVGPLLGVSSQAAASQYFRGNRRLSADQAEKIARFFGVTTDYLIAGKRVDAPAQRARKEISKLVRQRLKEMKVTDIPEFCAQFAVVEPAYLQSIIDAEADVGYNDVRILGPMLGEQAAAMIVQEIGRRDGAPA